MKKFTSVLILAFAVIFSAHSAMATSLDNRDLAFAFGSEEMGSEMQMLSEQEMVETEGRWWMLPVIGYTLGGGIAGTAAYLWSTPSTNWSVSGAGRAFGSGATAGFYSSPMGRPLGAVGRTVAGAFGSASWFNW